MQRPWRLLAVAWATALLIGPDVRAQRPLADAPPPVTFQLEGGTPAATAAARCQAALPGRGTAIVADLLPADIDPAPVVCHLLPTAAFRARFAGRLPDWGIGVALPGGRVIAVDWQRQGAGGGPRGIEEVFLHELAHALLEQGLRGATAPAWFHEGVAMRASGEWRFVDTIGLLLDGRPPRLDRLADRFPVGAEGAGQAYRISLLAVETLRRRHGSDVVLRIVDAVGRTGDFAAGFAEITGETPSVFAAGFATRLGPPLAWLVAATRWPLFFVVLALLLIVGGTVRLFRARRRLHAMAAEEADGEETSAEAAAQERPPD